jgi:type IV secretory pathway VirB6-like protein
MHYSYGSIAIVTLDMFGIFIDGMLLGIIFTRTKNIFASWIGHYLSDLIGIACLLFLL